MSRWIALSLLVLVSGCQQSGGPATVSATGKVLMAGQPVEGALVVFSRTDGDPESRLASQAETDASGQFSLRTYVGGDTYKDGVEPGEYVVTVTKLEVVQDMRTQPKHLLPKKYRMPSTSDLKAKVTSDGDNHFGFTLE